MQMGEILQAMGSVPWLDFVNAAAPVATAIIAYRALRNWQRQDRAKREAQFLDEVIDAAHHHIVGMQQPVEMLRMAKIGMASHIKSWEPGDEAKKVTAGALEYITKRGEQDGRRLTEALATVESSVVKLKSLAVKGQVFKFKEYQTCHEAIVKLTWHFGRLHAFTSMIVSPSWNWENDEVSGLLCKVMTIEPDDIMRDLGVQNAAIVEFARDTYKRIYG